ncbi:mitogen-activated protein kinase kinase kinase 20-like [Primulina huaijiensis]|uniref:mitogen-activated protein kinase kinase kinase 20-like n=1 Tax=Primulina huaijiensis TaxID=1492673 RepID=UPI003CC798D5
MDMDWVRGEKLGHGSFAMVNLAVPRSQSSSQTPPLMAVKSCGVSYSSSLMNEKLILDDLKDCPQIISCFGGSFSFENGERLYNLMLEYAPGGTLADKMKNSDNQRLPESEVVGYTKALLRGLLYIHKFGYVHCDLKLQNILLCPNGGVKIADFGLSKRAGKGSSPGCEFRGTPMYMSPETVTGGEQGAPADVWALGCVVAEMLTGNPVWRCSNLAEVLMKIGVGEEVPEIPGRLSEEGKDFLGKCFVKDPSKRWTAEMLLDHPFVSDNQYFDDLAAPLKDRQEYKMTVSPSPRCPFDFPDWESPTTCSITSFPTPEYSPRPALYFSNLTSMQSPSSPSDRMRELMSHQSPCWSVSDDWITIR